MPRLIKGHDLTPSQRGMVLAAFIYRWTVENPRRLQVYGLCPHCGTPGGLPGSGVMACRKKHPVMPLEGDKEWVAAHAFWFLADGHRLASGKGYDHAVPAWAADLPTPPEPAQGVRP